MLPTMRPPLWYLFATQLLLHAPPGLSTLDPWVIVTVCAGIAAREIDAHGRDRTEVCFPERSLVDEPGAGPNFQWARTPGARDTAGLGAAVMTRDLAWNWVAAAPPCRPGDASHRG